MISAPETNVNFLDILTGCYPKAIFRTEQVATSAGPRLIEFTTTDIPALEFHDTTFKCSGLCPDYGIDYVGHLIEPKEPRSLALVGFNIADCLYLGSRIDALVISQIQGRKLGRLAYKLLTNTAWPEMLVSGCVKSLRNFNCTCVVFNPRSLRTIYKGYPYLTEYEQLMSDDLDLSIEDYMMTTGKDKIHQEGIWFTGGFQHLEDNLTINIPGRKSLTIDKQDPFCCILHV